MNSNIRAKIDFWRTMFNPLFTSSPSREPPRQEQHEAFAAGARAMRDAMLEVSRQHTITRALADGEGEYYLGAEHAVMSLHEDLLEVPLPGGLK